MTKRTRANQRRRGIGASIKALFQSILIQAGCLSPNDNDNVPSPGPESLRRQESRHHGNGSYNVNNNNSNANNDSEGNSQPGRQQCMDGKDNNHSNGSSNSSNMSFVDGVEEKRGHLGHAHKYSGAMFSLQNCTLHCDACMNGETYWASFTERSFHKGHRFKLYRGVINGQGPQSGEKCVVKVFLRSPGTEELCRLEVQKSSKLRQLLRNFNQRTKNLQDRIRCPQTYWAPVDEVSKLKQLFFTGQRKLHIGESVLFEPDIRFTDDKPGEPRKVSRFMDSSGKQFSHHRHPVLDALAHYSYHETNGELVACGFEGVADEDGFSLTTPIIHSRDRSFGEGDLGEAGIMKVFNNHVCNALCHDLPTVNIPKPVETVQATSMDEVKAEEDDLGESSSMIADCQQDSVDANRNSHPEASVVTTSKASECTESMAEYLEPSAPHITECLQDDFLTPPPVYTRERAEHVYHWIQEEFSNSFLRMRLPPNGPLHNSHSHPAGLSTTAQTPLLTLNGDNCAIRRSSDVNANVPADLSMLGAISVYGDRYQGGFSIPETRSDDVMETISTNSVESSSYPPSTRGPSEAPTARSDVAMMETSSVGSQNSPHLQPRGRQGSVNSTRCVDNGYFGDHLRLVFQTTDDNRNRRSTEFYLDRLPSYEESESMQPIRQTLDGRMIPDSNNSNSHNLNTGDLWIGNNGSKPF